MTINFYKLNGTKVFDGSISGYEHLDEWCESPEVPSVSDIVRLKGKRYSVHNREWLDRNHVNVFCD